MHMKDVYSSAPCAAPSRDEGEGPLLFQLLPGAAVGRP